MTQPDPRRGNGAGADADAATQTEITEQEISDQSTPVASATKADSGDVLSCAMACASNGSCAWRPYECRLVGGAA